MDKAKRQSGIELLRIIVMLQIVFLHLYQYGHLHAGASSAGTIDGTFVTFVWSMCRAPVDVFVMISGYFMITSQFDIKRTIKRGANLYGAMFFYSRPTVNFTRECCKGSNAVLLKNMVFF